MRHTILLLISAIFINCDGLPKGKSLEQRKKENAERIEREAQRVTDSIMNALRQAELSSFAELTKDEKLIGKTLVTKYFYFIDKEGRRQGDTIFSNSEEFPTKSKFKLNKNSIIYSEGASQTWKGGWSPHYQFNYIISDGMAQTFIFQKNKLGVYRVQESSCMKLGGEWDCAANMFRFMIEQ